MILYTNDMENELENLKHQTQRMSRDPNYKPEIPKSRILENFQPLPPQLMPCFEEFTKDYDLERKNEVHAKLSQLYYETPSRTERAEKAFRASNEILSRRVKERSKSLGDGEAELKVMLWEIGQRWIGETKKADTFLERLEQFAYWARKMKEKGFSWYVTSAACGKKYLSDSDFIGQDEREQRAGFDENHKPYYLPHDNWWWNLGGNFKKHPYLDTAGDLDWMREWALVERDEAAQVEEDQRRHAKNLNDLYRAYEKAERQAYILIKDQKLTAAQTVEKLRSVKNPLLSDFDLETAVYGANKAIDKEEADRIFQAKADKEFQEPSESKPSKIILKPKEEEEKKDE